MGSLNSAIQAELDGEYRRAIGYYLRLANEGSMLDRVGIYQAIARCFEKIGLQRKAGYWHENAGLGYMHLPARVMGREERAYYAMVEFRNAVQNYAPALASRRKVVDKYLSTLGVCLKGGKEGYSHEMLFAAHLCVKIHEFRQAADFFTQAASQFKDEGQEKLARQSYLSAQRLQISGKFA